MVSTSGFSLEECSKLAGDCNWITLRRQGSDYRIPCGSRPLLWVDTYSDAMGYEIIVSTDCSAAQVRIRFAS